MPEGDVKIFGADSHVSKSRFPWVLGGAALVALLLLRNRGDSGGTDVSSQILAAQTQAGMSQLEFAQLQQQAHVELAQLMAMNKLESQAQTYAYQQSGAGQRMCIPLGTYYTLDKGTRKDLAKQVANGQVFETIGPDGICFTPTGMGIYGHAPLATSKSRSGLFGSSYSTTGPAGSIQAAPPPQQSGNIFNFLESIFRIFNQPAGL